MTTMHSMRSMRSMHSMGSMGSDCLGFSYVPHTPPVEEFDGVEMLLDTFLDSLADTVTDTIPVPEVLPETTTLMPTAEPVLQSPQTSRVPAQGTVLAALRRRECLYCGKKFKRSGHLKNHIRAVHLKNKDFHCSVCAKQFAVRSQLVVHMRVHSGKRPFACLHCNREFRQKMHRDRHMRVHTGEKPFVCNVCKRGFSQASSMKRHMRTMHAGAPVSLLGA